MCTAYALISVLSALKIFIDTACVESRMADSAMTDLPGVFSEVFSMQRLQSDEISRQQQQLETVKVIMPMTLSRQRIYSTIILTAQTCLVKIRLNVSLCKQFTFLLHS